MNVAEPPSAALQYVPRSANRAETRPRFSVAPPSVTKYDCELQLPSLRVISRTRALENTGGKLAVSAEAAASVTLPIIHDAVRQPHVRRLCRRLRKAAEVVEIGEDQAPTRQIRVGPRLAHAMTVLGAGDASLQHFGIAVRVPADRGIENQRRRAELPEVSCSTSRAQKRGARDSPAATRQAMSFPRCATRRYPRARPG